MFQSIPMQIFMNFGGQEEQVFEFGSRRESIKSKVLWGLLVILPAPIALPGCHNAAHFNAKQAAS
jgi:hypothetical protein